MSTLKPSGTAPPVESGAPSPGLGQMTHVHDPNGSYAGSYSLLPCTKVTTAACVDRPTMAGMIATLYDRLESYEEIAKRYGSFEDALKEEKHRGDRLEQELNTLRDAGIQLRG